MQADGHSMSEVELRDGRQRVVIVGNGIAAWFAAAMLAKCTSESDFAIVIVPTKDPKDEMSFPFGSGDATLPVTEGFLSLVAPNEDDAVVSTGGAFSFGTAFSGWNTADTSYFQPFGTTGAPLGPATFPHLLHRLRRHGVALRLANYSLPALAAQAGRFARPDGDPRSVLNCCEYGLHLPSLQLLELLRSVAEKSRALHCHGKYTAVEHGPTGDIAAVLTDAAQTVEGDWFLDCTSTAALSAVNSSAADWESWSDYLPCDRYIVARTTSQALPPYGHVQAHRAGWIRHIPVQGQMLLTACHQSAFMSDDEALSMLQQAATVDLSGIYSGSLNFGRRKLAWAGNCISLGAAATCIDPIGASNLHLLRAAIRRFIGLLPARRDAAALANEYNRQTAAELDRARDFALLHFKLNGRTGEPMWDQSRELPVPDTLDYKIRLYESRGIVAMYDEELFDEAAWTNLFDEHGVRPRQYKAVADAWTCEQIQAHAHRIRTALIDELAKMPAHADYVAKLAMASRMPAPV